MANPKVSVIIPVYNAEKYIERCLHSLFNQTLEDLEFIFINDKTPDASFKILQSVLNKYPNRKSQVKIIEMPVNSKQAAARTAGMKEATGDYMIHCDPDDWVELDMYEKLYTIAVKENADIVTCHYYRHKNGNITSGGPSFSGDSKKCLESNVFDWSLWNKLMRRKIIKDNNIFPFEGINCGEDLNVVIRALYFSHKIMGLPIPLYHYNCENQESITHSNVKNNIEKYLRPNIERITGFFKTHPFKGSEDLINQLKFTCKAPFLWNADKISYRDAKYWCNLWPESHHIFPKKLCLIYNNYCLLILYHRYLNKRKALNK